MQPLNPLSVLSLPFGAPEPIILILAVGAARIAGGSVGALTAVYARVLRVFEEIQLVVSGFLHALKNGVEKIGCPTSNVGHSTSEKLCK